MNRSRTRDRAFRALHDVTNRFLGWAADRPVVVRIVLLPVTLVISVIHVIAIFVRLACLLLTKRYPEPFPSELNKEDDFRTAPTPRDSMKRFLDHLDSTQDEAARK